LRYATGSTGQTISQPVSSIDVSPLARPLAAFGVNEFVLRESCVDLPSLSKLASVNHEITDIFRRQGK
jgi:hypothetical protein